MQARSSLGAWGRQPNILDSTAPTSQTGFVDPGKLIKGWSIHRQQIESSLRVLLVEVNRQHRSELQRLLNRCGCEVATAVSAEASLELVLTGQFPLVIVPSVLVEMDGLALVDQMRRQVADLEVILTTRDFSLDLVQRAFDLQIRDIIRKPLVDEQAIEEQVRSVVQHCVNGQMRLFLLSRLRRMVSELASDERKEAVNNLDARLEDYKGWLGRCDRIIVVEEAEELRHLSDHLFESHFQTEATSELENAIRRAGKGDINLLFMQSEQAPLGIQRTIGMLKEHVPQLDVVFIAPPQLQSALAALHAGASLYLPRIPESLDLILPRLRRVLARHRERRLMDNLLLELFRELMRLHGHPLDHKLMERFSWLMGVMPGRIIATEESLDEEELQQASELLDEMLTDIVDLPEDDGARPSGKSGRERRVFPRLEENRVVRFSPRTAPSKMLAYMGNVSEGGLYIRTNKLLKPGTPTEVDLSLPSDGALHELACEGQVMWIDPEGQRGDQGPGFGIKFKLPSEDMTGLLRQIIASRMDSEEE